MIIVVVYILLSAFEKPPLTFLFLFFTRVPKPYVVCFLQISTYIYIYTQVQHILSPNNTILFLQK